MKSTPETFHLRYCELTGYQIPFSADRLYPWELFCLKFTIEDLETVIRYIQRRKKSGRPARSLIFRSLISGGNALAFFEEDLACALRERPNHVDTAKASVLRATGRAEQDEMGALTAAEIMADSEKFQSLLRQFRKTL